MHHHTFSIFVVGLVALAAFPSGVAGAHEPNSAVNALKMTRDGQQIFRYDTFGDEAFWGGQLRLHETVATLSPNAALALGLKVDARAVPPNVLQQIRRGKLNLDDPNNTLALLKA